MATTPSLGSLSTADLAAKIRAKYPGAYDDKPDGVLVGAWLQKYPDYNDYLKPESQAQLSATANAQAAITRPIDQLQEKRYSIFTPTGISGTPEQLKEVEHAQNVTTATVGAMAALPSVAGALAPTTTAGAVGTGILDASGDEITREVVKYGPSLGKQAVVGAVKWVAANPGKAALAYQLARAAGVPLPDVLKKLFNVGRAVMEP